MAKLKKIKLTQRLSHFLYFKPSLKKAMHYTLKLIDKVQVKKKAKPITFLKSLTDIPKKWNLLK